MIRNVQRIPSDGPNFDFLEGPVIAMTLIFDYALRLVELLNSLSYRSMIIVLGFKINPFAFLFDAFQIAP